LIDAMLIQIDILRSVFGIASQPARLDIGCRAKHYCAMLKLLPAPMFELTGYYLRLSFLHSRDRGIFASAG